MRATDRARANKHAPLSLFPVALAGTEQFCPSPAIDELPGGDRLNTFVCFLALYARDVPTGALPGNPSRYGTSQGEPYAREALIPAGEFLALQHRSDRHLATYFAVRSAQIARRRVDFTAKRVPRDVGKPGKLLRCTTSSQSGRRAERVVDRSARDRAHGACPRP